MSLATRWSTLSRPVKTALILAVLAAYPVSCTVQRQINRARYQAQEAEFKRLCKDVAGYKIHKVVEDVEGIQLLKIRHRVTDYDMLAPDAAFALEAYDDGYISTFLSYRYPSEQMDGSYFENTDKMDGAVPGFRYVDVIDEQDGKRYRITGSQKAIGKKDVTAEGVKRNLEKDPNYDLNIYRWRLDRTLAPDPAPRYAVTFENPVIPAERARGMASSTVKVIDTQTNEVIAEMVRHVWGPSQPSAYNPNTWVVADKCPMVSVGSNAATRQFIDRVLVAKGATRPPLPDASADK